MKCDFCESDNGRQANMIGCVCVDKGIIERFKVPIFLCHCCRFVIRILDEFDKEV